MLTTNRSLYLFGTKNKIRMFVDKVVTSKIFEYFILVCILASSIFMAIEDPLETSDSPRNLTIYYCDIVVTIIFTFEVVLKVIAKGFIVNGPDSYMR